MAPLYYIVKQNKTTSPSKSSGNYAQSTMFKEKIKHEINFVCIYLKRIH